MLTGQTFNSFKNNIYNIINSKSTQEALKDALSSTFPGDIDEQADTITKYFGQVAAKRLADAIAEPLCNEIKDYILKTDIDITVSGSGVMSPHGPCTGNISHTNVKLS